MPIQLLSTIAFLLHATLGIPVGDIARPRLLVVVHAEGRAAADPGLLTAAAGVARDVWRPYVDVTFGRAGDIRRTIEVDQLDLVVTDRLLGRGDEDSGLGWIQFVDNQPASSISVSLTASEQLMQGSSWSGTPLPRLPAAVRRQFVTRAIGRSVAHEIGHYLLRSKVHARRGLMRDHFTADEIMDARYQRDRLDADDLKRLDGRLYEYAAAMAKEKPAS